MYVLAIETATPVVSVALIEAGDAAFDATLAQASARRPREHVEMLTPMVSWVLSQAGVAGGDVAGVAVGTGPGRFSGLRVGVSSAKAFAQAWGVPVVGVSTLDVLAAEQASALRWLFPQSDAQDAPSSDPVVCAVVDARRGECFAALYRVAAPSSSQGISTGAVRRGEAADGGLERVRDAAIPGVDENGIAVLEPKLLVNALLDLAVPLLLVGELQVLDGCLPQAGFRVGPARLGLRPSVPSAAVLGSLAAPDVMALVAGKPSWHPMVGMAVTPVYRRHPDADEAWSARLALAQEAARAS